MFNETTLAVRGFAGSNGQMFDNPGGSGTFVFPIGVTPRRWDREQNKYVDGATIWYDVRCYGQLADNAALSIHTGTPVLVRGRLAQRSWKDKVGRDRLSLVIIAESVGIDLNTGKAEFVKRNPNVLDPVDGEPVPRDDEDSSFAATDGMSEIGGEVSETSPMSSGEPIAGGGEADDASTSGYSPFSPLEDAEAELSYA